MRGKRILIVDDTVRNRVLMRAILEGGGYMPSEAGSGPDALVAVRGQEFDLIILDLVMPGMDGFAVLKALKADPDTRDIPVLVTSALPDEATRVAALDLGASDFLTQPVSRSEVLARVRSLTQAKVLRERLDGTLRKLTALVRTTEAHLATLRTSGALVEDPVAALLTQARFAVKAGRTPEVVAALEQRGDAFVGRLLRGEETLGEVAVAGSRDWNQAGPFVGVFNRDQDPMDPWVCGLDEALQAHGMLLRNAAVHVSYGIALVAMNYPGGADALDAEVLRGLTLHWAFVREIGLRIRETEEAFEYTVHALARAAEAYDDGTGLHILRVSEYSAELAGYLGLPADFVKAIHVQAQMHDVGKLHVPPEILQKPARLTPEEQEIFKTHTTSGAKILGDHPRLKLAASIALTHHERWDGTGYPAGLDGEAIPVEGRILAIADVYDALRAERRYKQAMDHDEARRVLLNGDGRVMPSHFDPGMLAAFERIAARFDDVFRAMPG